MLSSLRLRVVNCYRTSPEPPTVPVVTDADELIRTPSLCQFSGDSGNYDLSRYQGAAGRAQSYMKDSRMKVEKIFYADVLRLYSVFQIVT